MRFRSCCWIFRNLPRMRLRIVLRRTMKAPETVLPADVREAQKIERLWLPFSSTFPVLLGKPAELDTPHTRKRRECVGQLPAELALHWSLLSRLATAE